MFFLNYILVVFSANIKYFLSCSFQHQKTLDNTVSRDKIQTILYKYKQRTGVLSVPGISESCRKVQDSITAAQLARELWS